MHVTGISRRAQGENCVPNYSIPSLAETLDRFQPDAVINCVGVVGHDKVQRKPRLAHRINVELPESLAQLTKERNLGLIHFSSDSVYSGDPGDAPFSELSPTLPFSLYGAQKLESEARVLRANPNSVVMRINFFGWSMDGEIGMLDHFVRHAILKSRPIGYSNYFATSLYVGELSRAVITALRAKVSGVFNVGSPDSHSKLKFGQEVFSRLGLDPELVVPGDPSIWSGEGVTSRDLSMSSELIEKTLGITFRPQFQGISVALNDASAFLDFSKAPGTEVRMKVLEILAR